MQFGFGAPVNGPLSGPRALARIVSEGEAIGCDYCTIGASWRAARHGRRWRHPLWAFVRRSAVHRVRKERNLSDRFWRPTLIVSNIGRQINER